MENKTHSGKAFYYEPPHLFLPSLYINTCIFSFLVLKVIKTSTLIPGHLKQENILTLKAPKQKLQQTTLSFFTFIFQRKYGSMFHVNPLPSRGFTRNIKSFFSLKDNEKVFINVICWGRDWRFKG